MSVPTNTILTGDCLEIMKTLPDNSIDAIVSDPPYGLKFMGKDWDHGIPGKQYWEEALRVAKPGSHLLAFGGTRTHHRLMVAIEDAGWEIRDVIMWCHGSGFPKSLDVSKAIDKAEGAERKIINSIPDRWTQKGNSYNFSTDREQSEVNVYGGAATEAAKQWSGYGTALKPAWEPVIMARKPIEGTVASNVLTYGTGAINIDGCRIEGPDPHHNYGRTSSDGMFNSKSNIPFNTPQSGRFPANLILDEEAAGMLDEQSGVLKSGKLSPENNVKESSGWSGGSYSNRVKNTFERNSGGASRFFYCAKASPSERGAFNKHPTVKPLSLMRYLCRLVAPPGGLVLDPFSGSGSTLIAAKQEGFNYLGIELNPEYVEIAKARIASLPTNLSSFQ